MLKNKITPYERAKRLQAVLHAKRGVAGRREALRRFGVTKFRTFTRINAEGDVNVEMMFQLPMCTCGKCNNAPRLRLLPFSVN